MPARGGAWLAYLKEAPAPREATARGGDESRSATQSRRRTDPCCEPRRARAHVPSVLEYSVRPRRQDARLHASPRRSRGAMASTPYTPGRPTAPVAAREREGQIHAADLESRRERAGLHERSRRRGARSAADGRCIAGSAAPRRHRARLAGHARACPPDFGVSERGQLAFSRDGRKRLRARWRRRRSARRGRWPADERVRRRSLALERRLDPADAARPRQSGSQPHLSRRLSHRSRRSTCSSPMPSMRTVTLADDGSRAIRLR